MTGLAVFLVREVLLASQHQKERDASLFHLIDPNYAHFRMTVVEPDHADHLLKMAEQHGTEPPPFDIRFIKEEPTNIWLDRLAAFWAIAIFICLIFLDLPLSRAVIVYLSLLLILTFSQTADLDHLTCFASYISGRDGPGNLLASPFHLLITGTCLFLLFQTFYRSVFAKRELGGMLLFPVLALLLILAPEFLQRYSTFSYVHPLEAFGSPGALLGFMAFLSFFAWPIVLLETAGPVRFRYKLLISALIPLPLYFFYPAQLIAGISLILIWLIKDFRSRLLLKAALIVLVFYPFLVLKEQNDEILFVRNHVLDEITLMVERNHFRMGRIIQRIPEIQAAIEKSPHRHMMDLFARRIGLFEDEIDFALRLTDTNGNVLSEIEQHVSLDRIPYLLGPRDRIESFQADPLEPDHLVFRTDIETRYGTYEFVVVLGNDYQNLSLLRRLRYVSDVHDSGRKRALTPYFAYILDVFDREGEPLYNQKGPTSLEREMLATLRTETSVWKVDGRNTIFFFRDREFIYRITHKATPMKMILGRYVSLFMAVLALLYVIRLIQRPGRSLFSRWKRSFAMKMAGVMFLSSLLPTMMLGAFLITSTQSLQTREEEAIARSKILAAKKLFVENLERAQAADGRQQGYRTVRPGEVPIRRYSRILGEELSLFVNGSLARTNQPEVFHNGILERRLSQKLVTRLFHEKKAYLLERKPLPDGNSLMVAYTPVELAPNRQGVLGMTMIPSSQRQKHRWRERLELSLTLLLGLLFLMAELTRFFARRNLRPVAAITRGATRMTRSITSSPIAIEREDELDRMIQAFNTMQERIIESHLQLERQLDVLDETLKSMNSGLLGFDHQGILVLENTKAWELTHLQPGLENLAELTEQQPLLAPISDLFAGNEEGDFSFHIPCGTEHREVLANFRRTRSASEKDGDVCWLLSIEDVTNAMAASRFKAWSEMARRVAHEIKNPLTPIQLEVDFLTKMYQDQHPDFGEALQDGAQQILKQVQHLKRIATEFSDYARPVTLEKEITNLTSLIEEILNPYEKTLHDLTIKTHLEPDLMMELDARLLRRSLHNLVVNAIQAMEEMGELHVRLFRDGEHVNIWIQDTGPGIPEEERHRIFEAYFSTKDHGTGLGLVIARKYIDLHGGSLAIDPSYTHGTRFLIRLQETG